MPKAAGTLAAPPHGYQAAAECAAQEERLRCAIAAYEQLSAIRAEELSLLCVCSDEEVQVVYDFLDKMAAQLTDSQKTLTRLLRDLEHQAELVQGKQTPAGAGKQ